MAPMTNPGNDRASGAERDLVVHVPSRRVLDLSVDDDRDEIRSLKGKCHFGENAILVCHSKRNALYLQERAGNLVAVHEHGDCCPPRVIAVGMTDEHKWETEYLVRGFEAAGHSVVSEVLGKRARLDTGVIPDAIAYGAVAIGAEVQRSALGSRSAVDRTRKALAAGVTDVWFTDWPRPPKWALRVPTVGMSLRYDASWRHAPRGSVIVSTGARRIIAAKCEVGSRHFDRCPVTKRNWCGKPHAWHEPWGRLTVDDITEMAPAGALTPVKFMGRPDSVFLISDESIALYQELTGYAVPRPFTPAVIPAPRLSGESFGPVLCARNFRGDQLELDYSAAPPRPVIVIRDRTACNVPGCGKQGRLYPAGRRCDDHKPTPFLGKATP